MLVFWLVLSILLFTLFIFGFMFSDVAIKPHTHGYEETYKTQIDCGSIVKEDFEKLPMEEVYIDSIYGYKLHGIYFDFGHLDRVVIICHGITCSLYNSVKYMDMFIKRGFNVLIYDHRNHGRSGGSSTTYGYYEKMDLKSWTDWVCKRCGAGCSIGMLGESMGAATVLQNSAIDDRIKFYIADCPYSDLSTLLKLKLEELYHLPPFPFLYISSLITFLRTGMLFKWVSPIRDLSNVKTPIMFVHGKDDKYIPPQMSIDMYNAKKGIKKLYLAPNAGHAESYVKNPEEYDEKVGEFLHSIGM